jgi:hypothetical protein
VQVRAFHCQSSGRFKLRAHLYFNLHPQTTILNYSRLEDTSLIIVTGVPELEESSNAGEHYCSLALAEAKITIPTVHGTAILQHFNSGIALKVVFLQRERGSTGTGCPLAVRTICLWEAWVFRAHFMVGHTRNTDSGFREPDCPASKLANLSEIRSVCLRTVGRRTRALLPSSPGCNVH